MKKNQNQKASFLKSFFMKLWLPVKKYVGIGLDYVKEGLAFVFKHVGHGLEKGITFIGKYTGISYLRQLWKLRVPEKIAKWFEYSIFLPFTMIDRLIHYKYLTYKEQKAVQGVLFALPWIAGILLFFITPFFQSLMDSFYELTPQPGTIDRVFVGFANYKFALNEHTTLTSSFRVELVTTAGDVAANIPVMLIFSLFIAVMLNMEFRGRAFVRAVFFIPVILNSAAVASALGGGDAITAILEEQGIGQIFDLGYYLTQAGLPVFLVTFIAGLIGRIYDILALAGVPILLFLAAIQSIPKHLYEAAKIEGATSYEMFWLITLPNVKIHMITVAIYALVDTFLTSSVSGIIATQLNNPQYVNNHSGGWGVASAMAWIYVAMNIGFLLIFGIFVKVFKMGESHYENN